jgi:hypothetical protein
MSNSQVESTSAKVLAEIVFYCEKRIGLSVPEGVDIGLRKSRYKYTSAVYYF